MDGKFQSLARKFRYFYLTARAASTTAQRLAVYPPRQPHFLLTDGTGLVHINAMVLRGGTEEEVGVAQLLTAHPPRAEIAQMLRAFPLVGDFVAVRHR